MAFKTQTLLVEELAVLNELIDTTLVPIVT